MGCEKYDWFSRTICTLGSSQLGSSRMPKWKKKVKKRQRIVILICEYRALISWFVLIGLVLNERSYNSENHDTLGAYVTIDSAAFYSEHVRWLRFGICCDFVFVTHRDFVAYRGSKTRQYCSLTRKIGGLKTHFSA